MADKPTYEDLEQRVKELENEVAKRKRAEKALRKAHDELELRVEDRTAELTKANEQLRREIEEHKQAGEALQESERQASAAIQAARGFTFSYDIATGKIEWGGVIEGVTGYTPNPSLPLSG